MKKMLISCLAALSLTGCATIGPKVARESQQPYNEAIVHSWKEQLLLNLVRLRYRDNPYFLELNSLTSSYTLGGGFESESQWFPHGASIAHVIGIKPSVTYQEKPTLSYAPITGEKYVKQMLTPISPEFILLLSQSGWNIDRVFEVCVASVNNIYNAPTAAGPTPDFAPEYEQFHELTHLLRELQAGNVIELGPDPISKAIVLHIKENRAYARQTQELNKMLNISAPQPFLKLSGNILNEEEDTLKIQPRSLMGVMFYLSQAVEVPSEYIKKGYVTVTENCDGTPFNWRCLSEKGIRVHCQGGKPNATVRVKYNGYWYFIDDADLSSKTTFMLLSKLFDMQAGQTHSHMPTLTIPVTS